MKKIAILILNWNQPKLTLETIASVKKISTTGYRYHIFLIDNGSTDDSVDIFTKKYQKDPSIELVKLPDNLGFAGGNNVGMELSVKKNYDFVLLLNNDTIVHKDFLDILLDTLTKNQKIGIVGPEIYFAPGHEFHKDRYSKQEIGKVIWSVGGIVDWNNILFSNRGIDQVDRGQFNKPTSQIDNISGCCALIPTKILKKIGLFDNQLYLYDEDNDLCQRIIRAGYQLYCQPKSIIWHVNSGSSTSGGGALHDYFMTRNRLVFGFRYAEFRTKFALLRDSIRILVKGTPWQKRGVVDFYTNRLGKGSWR